MKLFLVYPHQLFAVEHLPPAKEVWVIEEPLYFADPIHAPIFHKQKLILHRASLRRYADQLREAGYVVEYWAYGELMREGAPRAAEILLRRAYSRGFREVHLFEPVDYLLERRLAWAAERCAVQLRYHDTPGFLTSRRENLSFQSQQKRYHQTSYYIWQRKRLNILLTPEGQPVGGKWTYDVENRKRLPKGHRSPPIIPAPSDPYVEEATIYSEKHFPQAWGAAGPWWLPTSHESARRWLRTFLEERLHGFGPYEDAFESEEPFLYHSILTPSLNIGLLTPAQVLQETLSYAKETEVPLSSLEGFIRQIIGWREYIRMVYDTIGTPLRKSNLWHHTQDFPEGWETATTGILPVDTTLRRLYRWGYTHHIERLMVLGSFLFLNEVHPDKVYAFFMRSYVDAYDWVMVPNVYGMSQHASALITTKPYFCGSRYLLNMSHYPPGPWTEKWDALFWGWISRHSQQLARYPRLRPLIQNLAKVRRAP